MRSSPRPDTTLDPSPHATTARCLRRRLQARRTGVARLAAMSVALLALVACGAPGGPTGPGDPGGPGTIDRYLLLDALTSNSVAVMVSAADTAPLTFQANVHLGFGVAPCGLAIGPDGRVYVTDYQGGRVLVIDRDSLLDGTATGAARLATIDLPGLDQPCGLAFDAAGSMWVADRQGATNAASQPNLLVQFDAAQVAAASGNVTLTPVRSLQPVHNTTITPETLIASWWIAHLAFDDQGRLWYVDRWRRTISRIDDPTGYPTGLVTDVEPDMQLSNAPVVGDQPAAQFIFTPHSIAFDTTGNVYVGMGGSEGVLRYATERLPSTGRTFVLPDATLTFPIPPSTSVTAGPVAVTLDVNGALWAASNADRALFRVDAPASEDGDVTPDVTTTWTNDGQTIGATFVWTTRSTP